MTTPAQAKQYRDTHKEHTKEYRKQYNTMHKAEKRNYNRCHYAKIHGVPVPQSNETEFRAALEYFGDETYQAHIRQVRSQAGQYGQHGKKSQTRFCTECRRDQLLDFFDGDSEVCEVCEYKANPEYYMQHKSEALWDQVCDEESKVHVGELARTVSIAVLKPVTLPLNLSETKESVEDHGNDR